MKGNASNNSSNSSNGFNSNGQGNPNTKQITVYRRKNPLHGDQQQEKLQNISSQQMYYPQQQQQQQPQLKEQQPPLPYQQYSYQPNGTRKSQPNAVVYTPVSHATFGVDSKGNSYPPKKQKGYLPSQSSESSAQQQKQQQPQQEGIQEEEEDAQAQDNYLSKSACLLDQPKESAEHKQQESLEQKDQQQSKSQLIQNQFSKLEMAFSNNNNRSTILAVITLGPSEEMKKLYLIGLDIVNLSVCEHCEFNITEQSDVFDHFEVIQRKLNALVRKSEQLIVSFAWETSKRLLEETDIMFIQREIAKPALVLDNLIPENYKSSSQGQLETSVLLGDLVDSVLDSDVYLATKVLSYFNSLDVQMFAQIILKLAKEHVEFARAARSEEIAQIQNQVIRCIQEAKERKSSQLVASVSQNSSENSHRDSGVAEVKNENREAVDQEECTNGLRGNGEESELKDGRRESDSEGGIVLRTEEDIQSMNDREKTIQKEINGLPQINRDVLDQTGENDGFQNNQKNQKSDEVQVKNETNDQELHNEVGHTERSYEVQIQIKETDQLENQGQSNTKQKQDQTQQQQQSQQLLDNGNTIDPIENGKSNEGVKIQNSQTKNQSNIVQHSVQVHGGSDNNNIKTQLMPSGSDDDAFEIAEMQIIRLLQNLKQERKTTLDQGQLLNQQIITEREQRAKTQHELSGMEQLVAQLRQDKMQAIAENNKLTQLNRDLQEDNLRQNEQIKAIEETQRESDDMVIELKARDRQNTEELHEKNKSLEQQKIIVKNLTEELAKKGQIIEALEAGRQQLDNQIAAEKETVQYLSVKMKRQEQESKTKDDAMKRLEEENKSQLVSFEGLLEDIKQKELKVQCLEQENRLTNENLKQIEECLLRSEEKTNIIELEVSKKTELMENLKASLNGLQAEVIEERQKGMAQQAKIEEQERQLEELRGQLHEKENNLREVEEERVSRAAENERQQIALQEASKLLIDCSQALLQKNPLLSVSQMRESFCLNSSIHSQQSNSQRNICNTNNNNNGMSRSSNNLCNPLGSQSAERIEEIQDVVKDAGKEEEEVQQVNNTERNQEKLEGNKDVVDDRQENRTGVMHVGEHSRWSWDEDKEEQHEGQDDEEEEKDDRELQKQEAQQDYLKCAEQEESSKKEALPDTVAISPKEQQQISEGCCSDFQQSQVKHADTNNSQQTSEDDELIVQLQGALAGNPKEEIVEEIKEELGSAQKTTAKEDEKEIQQEKERQNVVVHVPSKQKKLKDRMMNAPPSKPFHFQATIDHSQQQQQQRSEVCISSSNSSTGASNNLQEYVASLQQQQQGFASVWKDDLSMFEQTAQMKQLFASPPKNLFEENPFISAMMQKAQEYAKRGQLQQQQEQQEEETVSLPLSSKVPITFDFSKGSSSSSSRSYYSEGNSQRRNNGWVSRVQRLNEGKQYKGGSRIVREEMKEQGQDSKEDKEVLVEARERRWERKSHNEKSAGNIAKEDERKENKLLRGIEDDEDDSNDSQYEDDNRKGLFQRGKKYLTQQLNFKYIRKADEKEVQEQKEKKQVQARVEVKDEIESIVSERNEQIPNENKLERRMVEKESKEEHEQGAEQEEEDYSYQDEEEDDDNDDVKNHSNDEKGQIFQQDKVHDDDELNYAEDHCRQPTNTNQDSQIQQISKVQHIQSDDQKLDCCNTKSHFSNLNAPEYLNIYELIGVGQMMSAKQAAELVKERQDHATMHLRKRQEQLSHAIPQHEDIQMLVAVCFLVNEETQPAEVTQITASVINTDNAQIIDEFDQMILMSTTESKANSRSQNQNETLSRSLNSRDFSFSYSALSQNQQNYMKPFSKNAKRLLSSESRYKNTNFNAKNKTAMNFRTNYTSDAGNQHKNYYGNGCRNTNNPNQYIAAMAAHTTDSQYLLPPSKGFAYGFAKLCNFLKQFLDNYKCALILESQAAQDLLHDCFIKYRVLPCEKHLQIFYSCVLLADIFPSSLSGLQAEMTSITEAASILKIERKQSRKGNHNFNNLNPWNYPPNASDAKLFGKVISALLTKGITVTASMLRPTFESENMVNQAGKYIANISECFRHNHVFMLLSFQPGRDSPTNLGSSVVSISVLARDSTGHQFIHLTGALGLQYDFYRCDVSPFYFYFMSYLAALNISTSLLTFLSISEHEALTIQFLDLIHYQQNHFYHCQNTQKQSQKLQPFSSGQSRSAHSNSIVLSDQLSSFIGINLDNLVEKFKPSFDFKLLFHALVSENLQLQQYIASVSATIPSSQASSTTTSTSSIQHLLKKWMSQ